MFCQVGIVSLEFLGTKNEIKKKKVAVEKNNDNENKNKKDEIDNLFDVCFDADEIDEKYIDEKIE